MADILIVDDETTLLANLTLQLGRAGHQCRTADTARAALASLESREPDVAIVDIRMPDMSGLDLIDRIRQAGRDFPVVVMTAYGSVENAVAAMKVGATDYLQKPVSIDELEVVLNRVLEQRKLADRLAVFERERERQGAERTIIGKSRVMRDVLELAGKIAAQPADENGHLPTVLITGETGTGKDLLAHHIHDLGPRRDEPFVQINCTALPGQLAEAELFGYERGAFTDAKSTKKGLFEVAGEGTIFLDEIGDMPLALQAKLLLVLEQREFRRLGATRVCRVRARTIAATNCNLTKLVAEGRFRKDLLFRFQALAVEVPPLRERADDLYLLADFFLERRARRLHRTPPALSPAAREAARRYSWPGNVRELDNVLQRALLINERDAIEPSDLNLSHGDLQDGSLSLEEFRFPFGSEDCSLATVEQKLIVQALEACNGNVSEAARLLGLRRGTLRHRLEKLSIAEHVRKP